jgi:DNA-binding NarL/FixJ family response regulator
MLTIHEKDQEVFEALEAGATGYLVKRTPAAEILRALEDVHAGGAPMSSGIARRVIQTFQRHGQARRDLEGLTVREQEILEQLARGYSYKEIAGALNIGVETVRRHLAHVYEKLHVHSRAEAAAKYLGV